MSNRQGFIKDYAGSKIIPETLTTMITDVAREQGLSASMAVLVESNALGFPVFVTTEAHASGSVCFYDRRLWVFTEDVPVSQSWDSTRVREFTIKEYVDAIQAAFEDGTVVAKLAENLNSWAGSNLTTEDTQSEAVFTTGGDESIDSSVAAEFVSIGAKTDFSATSLVFSGKNLLRLQNNNGVAVAISGGYYFPVPAMAFGVVNTAAQPNGVLFTDADGNNLHPTVYFKPLSSGVPTSVTDGTVCEYTEATSEGTTYRFYTTSQPGYLIVSGITWANTCARIAWSGVGFAYNAFVSPADANDAGSVIPLTAAIAAAHANGKLLTIGSVADSITREDATHLRWTANVDRVQPSWTNTLQEDETTYLHTAVISGMKSGGAAQFESANQELTIDGTTISYTDTNATALTDYVKYEKATASTGTVAVESTNPTVEDYGIIVLVGASGSAYTTIAYAQGIADNLRALVAAKMSSQMVAVSEAIGMLFYELETLKKNLQGENCQRVDLTLGTMDAVTYKRMGFPTEIQGAGVPSAGVTPDDWDTLCPGVTWTGVPLVPGMFYFDTTNKHWYKAKLTLTGSVNDWIALF